MYKHKVPIPPLIMQDDTITISTCGIKTQRINTMINTCANFMGLQFGSDKCVKMHIGKRHNTEICGRGQVDSWKAELIKNENGLEEVVDRYDKKQDMKTVEEISWTDNIKRCKK